MARVFFQRSASVYRKVRGEVIRRVQMSLQDAGASPGDLDGIYGGNTETALKTYQSTHSLQVTGKLTDETWSQLMGPTPPAIRDRCLQLTADFEGHGFQKVAGNFDGAGLTWGIIGFILQNGELQGILNEIRQDYPQIFEQAFGGLKDKMIEVLGQSLSQQMAWANGISIGSVKYKIEQPWADAFAALGASSEVQAIQLKKVDEYWDIAARDAHRFNLGSEMGIALCFDIAVQNGGIDFGDEEHRIQQWIRDNPGVSERDLRLCIADVVAESSKPKYIEDVRKRKRTVASGDGQVHGAPYATRDWGIAEDAWA